MPPKRAPKAPPAPARSPAKKASRPAATKKKQAAPPRPAKKALQKTKYAAQVPTEQLANLLQDRSASVRSIVDFVVGPTCGLESLHNTFYYKNMTPFLLAVYANRLDVAQLLVAEHSADTKAVTDRNHTALHFASYKGNVEMVRWLVEQCGLDVRTVDATGGSPLDWAINNRHNEVALLLLELGADPNTHAGQWTSLHLACFGGLVDVARVLIAKGVPRDVVDAQGMTPLDIAVLNEHLEVAALLRARPHH